MEVQARDNFLSEENSRILTICSLKYHIIGRVKPLTNTTERKLTPKRFTASSSDSGNMMEYSYLMHVITLIILVIEIYRAHTPKSSGPYRRVKTGTDNIVRIWAKVVPPASVSTSNAKLSFLLFSDQFLCLHLQVVSSISSTLNEIFF